VTVWPQMAGIEIARQEASDLFVDWKVKYELC